MSAASGPDGGAVRLRPVMRADYEWLYHLLVVTASESWRFRGATPSPNEFEADLWTGIHAQFVVSPTDGPRAGIVGMYKSNLVAGHSHIFAVAEPAFGALVIDGARRMCDWAIKEFELQKLWFEVPEFNLGKLESLTRHGTVEGRLTNFDYRRGRFWDLLIISMTAEQWAARRSRTPTGVLPATLSSAELLGLVDDVWPIDSLGAVELLEMLEERLGCPLDATVLAGLDLTDPARFAEGLAAKLRSN